MNRRQGQDTPVASNTGVTANQQAQKPEFELLLIEVAWSEERWANQDDPLGQDAFVFEIRAEVPDDMRGAVMVAFIRWAELRKVRIVAVRWAAASAIPMFWNTLAVMRGEYDARR